MTRSAALGFDRAKRRGFALLVSLPCHELCSLISNTCYQSTIMADFAFVFFFFSQIFKIFYYWIFSFLLSVAVLLCTRMFLSLPPTLHNLVLCIVDFAFCCYFKFRIWHVWFNSQLQTQSTLQSRSGLMMDSNCLIGVSKGVSNSLEWPSVFVLFVASVTA